MKSILTPCQKMCIIWMMTQCQNKDEQKDTNVKKNIGSPSALYPTPVTVIGTMNGDKTETGEVIGKCLSLKTGENI